MLLNVTCKTIRVIESSPTKLTLVRLLIRMYLAHVPPELRIRAESFVTDSALEFMQVSMDSHVQSEISFSVEIFFAPVTLVNRIRYLKV